MIGGRAATLLGAALAVGTTEAFIPPVPWWAQLIMAVVSAALAFFGGQAQARGR